MRHVWTFLIGIVFAGFVMMVSAPLVLAGMGVAAWLSKGTMFHALSGESVFGVRDHDGRMDGRMVNVTFHLAQVPQAAEPTSRRLLLRLEVTNADVFAAHGGEGLVRVDAWSLDRVADIRRPALYTTIAPGRSASLSDDGTLAVDHGTRHSVYALANGQWLYDWEALPATFVADGDRRRTVALASAEDDMPPRSVAVLTLSSPQAPLKRVLIQDEDPVRARLLRSSAATVRPMPRQDDASHRSIDLALAAGMLRIPVKGDDLDLAGAQLPPGLSLVELTAWGARGK